MRYGLPLVSGTAEAFNLSLACGPTKVVPDTLGPAVISTGGALAGQESFLLSVICACEVERRSDSSPRPWANSRRRPAGFARFGYP